MRQPPGAQFCQRADAVRLLRTAAVASRQLHTAAVERLRRSAVWLSYGGPAARCYRLPNTTGSSILIPWLFSPTLGRKHAVLPFVSVPKALGKSNGLCYEFPACGKPFSRVQYASSPQVHGVEAATSGLWPRGCPKSTVLAAALHNTGAGKLQEAQVG